MKFRDNANSPFDARVAIRPHAHCSASLIARACICSASADRCVAVGRPVNLRRRLVSPPMPGNEILNTPLCPPFLPFLLGHHENNQASARESWAALRRLDQAFNTIFFQGGSSSLTCEILFSTLRNAIDGTMGEALIRSWCAEARMRPLPVGGGGSG